MNCGAKIGPMWIWLAVIKRDGAEPYYEERRIIAPSLCAACIGVGEVPEGASLCAIVRHHSVHSIMIQPEAEDQTADGSDQTRVQ